jgi:hypothetical protein
MTCAPTATRTRDLLLRRQSLYPLSYRGPCQAYRRMTSITASGPVRLSSRPAPRGHPSGQGGVREKP